MMSLKEPSAQRIDAVLPGVRFNALCCTVSLGERMIFGLL